MRARRFSTTVITLLSIWVPCLLAGAHEVLAIQSSSPSVGASGSVSLSSRATELITSSPSEVDTIPFAPCTTTAQEIWTCDFESGEDGCGGWTTTGGSWQIGDPEPSIGTHSGTWCAATVLQGYYAPYTSARLVSSQIALPGVQSCESLELRFWHWYSFGSADEGHVQIRTRRAGGVWGAWADVRGNDVVAWVNTGSVWTRPSIDLTSYADSTVQIGFYIGSDCCSESWGWYLDDVVVQKHLASPASAQLVEGFEAGLGEWAADAGQWEVGDPSPTLTPHSGNACAGTVLNGIYSPYAASRLVSPRYVLPSLSPGQYLRLHFWHWFSCGSADYGNVQIRTLESGVWGPWSALPGEDGYVATSVIWTPRSIDLTAFAGSTVQIGFALYSDCCSQSYGWYVDDITILRGPLWSALAWPDWETFATGIADWSADAGEWTVGTPTAAPAFPGGIPHSGAPVAGTVIDGYYAPYAGSRLISPAVKLDPSPCSPTIRFLHWYSLGSSDYGQVQVSVRRGQNWGPWTNVADGHFSGGSSIWYRSTLDLSAYADSTVRIGFLLASDCCSEGPGWYIDDVQVRCGHSTTEVADGSLPPQAVRLAQNVPNPFNPTTSIEFALGSPGQAELVVLDVAGHHIRTLVSGVVPAGHQRRTWDGRNDLGATVSSGVYLCRLRAANTTVTRRMVLMR